jgi:two-component system copper resistance phosphate regulon response regulator CusR
MVHILIIEDDKRVSELIQRGLQEQGYQTSLAYDAEVGQKMIYAHSFDLLIMDIILPGINGIDLCKQVREMSPAIPIIMLTALGTTDDKLEGFDAGADDYLVKPFDFRELHARIKALLKRKKGAEVEPVAMLRIADLEMDLKTKRVLRAGEEISLTPKEFKLLEYMLRNQGRVLSRGEIADKVWETTFDTGTNFIDVYINYLRKKVDKSFPVKLIHTRPGMGFILQEPLI